MQTVRHNAGGLLGCGLFHDGVLAHDVSLNVRPSDECLRRVSGRRDGELLDMGQRTGHCRFYLLNAVYGKEPFLHQLLPCSSLLDVALFV